jgi:hypothetical protein
MHLAQLNIARMVDEPDSETMREFMEALEPINLLAEKSAGFVWRLQDGDGPGAIDQRMPGHEGDDRLLVNLSVWMDVESLRHFTIRSGHAMYLRRRREWFERATEATTVLWWVDEGHTPDLEEAANRLALLREHGPTPQAFDLSTVFGPNDGGAQPPTKSG